MSEVSGWQADRIQEMADASSNPVAREISDRGRWFRNGLAEAALQGANSFTWEDVDALRAIVDQQVGWDTTNGAIAYSLADRIAALLPPRLKWDEVIGAQPRNILRPVLENAIIHDPDAFIDP